jgi:hypothetical protein
MCLYSGVMDDFSQWVPKVSPVAPPVVVPFWEPQPTADLEEMSKLLEALRAAADDAKKKDAESGAPDCTDPEKAKLMERVAELERIIANPPEFVIVAGVALEPGKYRVIEGTLYKVVE